MATSGTGILMLQGSSWFTTAPITASYRRRLDELLPGLELATQWLAKQAPTLRSYDRHAPNRQLINALAFLTMARLEDTNQWASIGEKFLDAALQQQHQLGYFVEGGGYDSSYNGVALAVGLRLSQLGQASGRELEAQLLRSAQWQLTRVAEDGEIRTDGNARVHSAGESFMGKPKQVDVAHTVEAFLLAWQLFDDATYLDAAEKICRYYLCD